MPDAGGCFCTAACGSASPCEHPAVAAFVVIFLLRRFGEGLPTAEAFWKGAVYALVIAFCWALGVWAAVGPEPSDDDGRQDGEAVGNVGSRAAWRGRVLCVVLWA